ncbi:MAG TPA: ATP-binding protein [Minicystis sp.]|nr:ATP-binding protein [Minicystis sp.]
MRTTTALVRRWLAGLDALRIVDEASVSEVRETVRAASGRLGIGKVPAESLVTAASELAHNQLRHARGGAIAVRPIVRLGVPGLEVVAADAGEGIADPSSALGAGPSTAGGLGIGLHGVLQLSDEVDFDVRQGEGTCVWARKFAEALPRRRKVAIFGRPITGEVVSGDDAAFARLDGDALAVAVADGLGHGVEARAASNAAIDAFLAAPDRAPDAALAAAHDELGDTRGAVMAVARLGADGAVAASSVGNVTMHVAGRKSSRRFGAQTWVLGQRAPRRPYTLERASIEPHEMLVLFSDGLGSKLGLDGDDDLLREPPLVTAHELLKRYGKDHDDALVLVAR